MLLNHDEGTGAKSDHHEILIFTSIELYITNVIVYPVFLELKDNSYSRSISSAITDQMISLHSITCCEQILLEVGKSN